MSTVLAPRAASMRRLTPGLAIAASALLLAIANRWGDHLMASGRTIDVRVPPLYAVHDTHVASSIVIVIAVGALLSLLVHRAAAARPWRTAVATSFGASIGWTVAVNATRGLGSLTAPLRGRHEYLVDVAGSPLTFVREFTEGFHSFATHTRGHPPGFVALLSAMDAVGLGGARWATLVCVAGGAVAVVAVLTATRDVAGEFVARRAMPFVALAPAGLWFGTSADAFFAGLGACAVAAIVHGTVRGRPSASLLGGVFLGCTLLCTYGAVLLVAIPGAVAVRARRVAPLIHAAVTTTAVLLVARAAGFDYLEGLRLTRAAYFDGVASSRPYSYALVANLAALAVVVGPATVAGLTRLRGGLGVLVSGAIVAVVLADVSGMSRLEVERIWLPFAVWMLPAAAIAAASARMERPWLALHMGWALAVQTVVRTGW